jgi:hypothetical protein
LKQSSPKPPSLHLKVAGTFASHGNIFLQTLVLPYSINMEVLIITSFFVWELNSRDQISKEIFTGLNLESLATLIWQELGRWSLISPSTLSIHATAWFVYA